MFADTTVYAWEKTEFEAFEEWAKNKPVPENYGRFDRNRAHLVIDWVVATNRNARKAFFGVALGGNPHANPTVEETACDFIHQFLQWQRHRHQCWLGGKMNDPVFAADRAEGAQDGYWQQPERKQTEGYLFGHEEGLSRKRAEGYDV